MPTAASTRCAHCDVDVPAGTAHTMEGSRTWLCWDCFTDKDIHAATFPGRAPDTAV